MDLIRLFFGFFIFLPALLQGVMVIGLLLWRTRYKKIARKFVIGALIPFLFINLTPVGRWMLTYFENYYPQRYEIPSEAKGLILLVGNFDLPETRARKRPIFNKAAARLFDFIYLAQQYPQLPIIFTGTPEEAQYTQEVFDKFGIDPKRVQYENQSQNTKDNAQKTAFLLKEEEEGPWVLVTSAFHMPRSVALFKGEGIKVVPYPVDYHTSGQYSLYQWMDIRSWLAGYNTYAWAMALGQWAGLFSVYLEGKSSDVLPKRD